jgi:glyoxylase-like metal-dependent hydrolase (beta-lactamase superfamily II)
LIRVPSVFPVGPTNCYLINEGQPSLIDVGLKSKNSYDTLTKELSSLGLAVRDIGRIIVTHAHVDHFGLIRRLQETSSCDVYVHVDDFDNVSNYEESYLKRLDYFGEILSDSGASPKIIDELESTYQFIKDVGGSPLNCKKIKDGNQVELGNAKLEVFHMPGHTIGELTLLWREKGILFCGDHLLKDITPNVGVTLGKGIHRSLLPDYVKSLQRTLKLPGNLCLPGHRDIIEDFRGRAVEIMNHHEERKRLMLKTVANAEKNAFEISKEVFGKLTLSEIPLAVAETMSHMKVLEDEGRASSKIHNGVVYYTANGEADTMKESNP